MRVIRTELYFDSEELKRHGIVPSGADAENFGVAFAFFRGDEIVSGEEISTVLSDDFVVPNASQLGAPFYAMLFIQNLLRGGRSPQDFILERRSAEQSAVVSFIAESSVVIEQSPPVGVEWFNIAKSASSAVIGTFVGFQVTPPGSPLLFLTIPAGIIVVGTALGVSKGLENGLNKKIEKLINSKKRLRS